MPGRTPSPNGVNARHEFIRISVSIYDYKLSVKINWGIIIRLGFIDLAKTKKRRGLRHPMAEGTPSQPKLCCNAVKFRKIPSPCTENSRGSLSL